MNYFKHKAKVVFLTVRAILILFKVYRDDRFQTASWIASNFGPPMPPLVKRMTLEQRSNSKVWVESGTYLGQTTKFLLDRGNEVYTIEPDFRLHSHALEKFKDRDLCSIYLGDSAVLLPDVLRVLDRAKPTAFWLDGHYSGTGTFQGDHSTPIREELVAIEKCIGEFDYIEIFIDDIREFVNQSHGYPPIEVLTNFARANSFNWTIENDIFHMFPNQ